MAKYAVVWTTTKGYMPGTNASLNGFEVFGHDVDIYILTWDDFLTDDYKKQWDNINFHEIDIAQWPKKNTGWYLRFSDILFALKNLFTEYDVILFWGGDQCLVSNIMDLFEISHKLDTIIMGTNEHGTHIGRRSMSNKWPYTHTWSIPYADIPLFIPKNRTAILNKTIEYQGMPGCSLSYMDGLNYAAMDLDERIMTVPGELWVQNVPYRVPLARHGNTLYIKDSSTSLRAFHRKYWNNTICKNYLPANEISRQNKMLFNQMYNYFNRECRVKWTESLEVWDGK